MIDFKLFLRLISVVLVIFCTLVGKKEESRWKKEQKGMKRIILKQNPTEKKYEKNEKIRQKNCCFVFIKSNAKFVCKNSYKYDKMKELVTIRVKDSKEKNEIFEEICFR